MFFEEAVWVLRPLGPTAKTSAQPGRAEAQIPQHCPSAVGAAHFHLNRISTPSKNISRMGLQNRRSLGYARSL